MVLVDESNEWRKFRRCTRLPRAFSGEERAWYRGLAYLDDRVIPVIQPGGFLDARRIQRLDRAARAAASLREMEGAVQA